MCLPKINVIVEDTNGMIDLSWHEEAVFKIIQEVVPVDFFDNEENKNELPVLKHVTTSQAPWYLVFYFLSKSQKHSLKFVIEMISNWLIPGQRLNLTMMFASDFTLINDENKVYKLCKIVINLDTETNLELVKENLALMESEIRLGLESPHYARRILEIKGGSNRDLKISLIQENIAYLIKTKPQYFDSDLLIMMQQILVGCHDEFKSQRSSRHLTRIICVQYYFRKRLLEEYKRENKRQLFLKVFRTELQFRKQQKQVLGLIVGYNSFKENEVFEKRHFLQAILNLIPNVAAVENSSVDNHQVPELFRSFYMEIEKTNGELFTDQEITKLRQQLSFDLLQREDQLIHPLFMPRNEEEIMRNIFSLSRQIKYSRDLPQVIINFDEQTNAKLIFTIIVVRVIECSESSIQELFNQKKTSLEYVHDRCKTLGMMRGKRSKEATVFSVKVAKDDFIRQDNSIDLNKARQSIVLELLKVIGEFRDFNGGMISKQNELLAAVKKLMLNEAMYNELLLENFFFSMNPVVMRTVLDPLIVKTLYILFMETKDSDFEENKNIKVVTLVNPTHVYQVIKSEKPLNRDDMINALNVLEMKSTDLTTAFIEIKDIEYHCFIYQCEDPLKQELFRSIIQKEVE